MDIDGDGSFLMNCQELATAKIERLEIKTFILNNQHLGMVVQWEDRFYKANRAHTYLGSRVHLSSPSCTFPRAVCSYTMTLRGCCQPSATEDARCGVLTR